MIDVRRAAAGLGLRKALRALLNRASHAARLGNYWYWTDPPELRGGVAVADIVCPLRYDVLVRAEFLSFYAERRALYAADADAFLALARRGSYYRWFVSSEAVRTKPELLGDQSALDAAFTERVGRAAALYESVATDGFCARHPIILKTAERLLPPTAARGAAPTGKRVATRYFLADGCHRLALLMALGYRELPPQLFRVKCFRTFSPFDSTSLLARSLPIEPAAYFRFLSRRYCAPQVFEDVAGLLRHVRVHRPELLDEARSVIRADGYDAALAG
jgi:hypothetical protein